MHELDQVDRIRSALIPPLDKILDRVGLYSTINSTTNQYALTIVGDAEHAEKVLHMLGFLRNGLAAYKTLQPYGIESSGSWAWRYDPGDFGTYRWFGERQLHLTLFEVERERTNETHVIAHDELNPWRYPVQHYHGADYRVEWARRQTMMVFAHNDANFRQWPDIDTHLDRTL